MRSSTSFVGSRGARVNLSLNDPSSSCRLRFVYGPRNDTLLESVRLGVTTWTFPVVAPAGTVVVIRYLDTTVNVAAVPLKLTLVAPVRSLPRILTAAPTGPEVVCVSTNGTRPTDKLKTVPAPVRSLPRILTAAPTGPEVVCVSTNGTRPTDKLKTVPAPMAPPKFVVP